MDSLSDMGLSFSVQFPPFWVSVLCSSSVSSALIGEPQNLLAKDEDLYSADLHRVNSKAFLGGETSDMIGRKWTMALAAVVFQAGAGVMVFAPSFEILMIGRLLAGIGIGFGVMIAPVYIAEISPTIAKGSLTSFPEIFINLGILLGYVSNYAFSGLPAHINWRIMLGVGILPSVFIGFALFIIPESPRWLKEASSCISELLW
ncbi:PREDICTED: polyol transporter [Prunus dulcis]|uniref:PREDICTED: polyol transporter n=1 Tax=Prunus dulcis TaxID=3755 RepID=A0A5E4EN63_PRUDU|nr:probable polyol transporter 4 [Prunus dulcis]XP_034224611.1 probable polyol transporter 4 [Prunus dulcis]KAI5318745.1 hypothetical protein L3X38_038453 [Prunus dulcis]VVA15288.1 PREDICTED: polyol transporter [Prunus dulcis]VVA16495.1 PREDICTED: polyol transporter [Prunus dulcis]